MRYNVIILLTLPRYSICYIGSHRQVTTLREPKLNEELSRGETSTRAAVRTKVYSKATRLHEGKLKKCEWLGDPNVCKSVGKWAGCYMNYCMHLKHVLIIERLVSKIVHFFHAVLSLTRKCSKLAILLSICTLVE